MSSRSSRDRSAALVNPHTLPEIRLNLERRGFVVYPVPACRRVDPRLSGHPDLQVFTANGYAFVHPDIGESFESLCAEYAKVVRCETSLGEKYPFDCPYNIAFTGKYALCMERIVPIEIRKFLTGWGIQLIDIPQGYAKCSILVVDENSIITEDEGIRKRAQKRGLDVLIVRKGFFSLEGFPHGFIGGISGTRDDTVYLTGNTAHHPDHENMISFIAGKGKRIAYLSPLPATDTGSIIFL